MWTRGWIASPLGTTTYLLAFLLCLWPDARAWSGLTSASSSSESDSKREADTAYYLSTTYVQQQLAALYNRPRPTAVPQWGRFDTVVTNSRLYDNPFEDVALEVKLTKPDGGTVNVVGFYDGETSAPRAQGGIWRVRFMPDQVGTWRYEARFSDGSAQVDGAFLCVGFTPGAVSTTQLRVAGADASVAWPPGQICAYKNNPIWFGFKGGKAVLVRSLQTGERFFADHDNSITGLPWGLARRDAFLDWAQKQGYNMLCVPVTDSLAARAKGWNTPLLWDANGRRPDCAEYRRLEAILDDLADRGMLVYPMGSFWGPGSGFPTDEAKRDMAIRYTLARLGCYWNLLLDPVTQPPAVPQPAMFSLLEGPAATDLGRLSRIALERRDETRPLYAVDTLWAGSNRHPSYSPTELRKCAYILLMSGATINFADLNGDFSSGFSGTLDLKRKVQSRHDILKNAWDYFDRIPFWRLKSRQDLVDTGYCLADPGQRYLVYLDHPGTVTVRIDDGSYQVAWINARDTNDVRKAGMINSRRALTSPQEQDDWLLSLVRVEIVGGAIRER
jgi:hypothetical protein